MLLYPTFGVRQFLLLFVAHVTVSTFQTGFYITFPFSKQALKFISADVTVRQLLAV
jgi:hypothetical protein